MQERRRFLRYNCAYKVDYATLGIVSVESRCVSRNISRGGMRLPVSRLIKSGDLLRMSIYPPNETTPVVVMAKVKWTKPEGFSGRFNVDAGVEFTDIKTNDTQRLIQQAQ